MSDTPKPPDIDVNIPAPQGLRVATEDLPYHMLLLVDLAGSPEGSLSGPLQEGVVSVSASAYPQLMPQARPAVRFKTTDPIASGNVMTEIEVVFESLKDFDPNALAGRLPQTRPLMALREKIVDRLRGQLSTDALASAVSSSVETDPSLAWVADVLHWSPATSETDPSAVDDLLGQLDLGGDADAAPGQPPAKSDVGKMVSAAAGGSAIPAEESSACRRALAEIDRRISAWVTMVLHSPQIQALESAWRSLHLLVSRMDFRKGVRLSVLHARSEERLERFRTRLIDPVFDEGAAAPDLIVVAAPFAQTASDMEALDELAQHAASLPAVAIAGVGASFFGLKHTFQMATLPPIPNLLDQWQFAKFKSLRAEPYARNLGLVFGRCLLRTPHQRGDAHDLEFAYGEPSMTEKDFLWASGPVAAACTIARSVAETGWPTGVTGYVHGRLEGFPSAQGGKKGDKTFGPTDTRLPESKIEELGMAGINAVVASGDAGDVLVWNGMTTAAATRDDPNAILEVSLPYQLFACRLSALMFALKTHLSGQSAEQIAAMVKQHVQSWLPGNGQANDELVCVQVRQVENDPSQLEMAATVTPPPDLLPGGVPVVLGYRI